MTLYELFFGGDAAWFSVAAFAGTAFFLLRVAMLLLGAGHDAGFDMHGDIGHVGGEAHVDTHADSTHSFQILTIQGIAAFLMGFGWGALAGYRGMEWHPAASIGLGSATGIGMAYLLGVVMKGMADLQTSGTISIQSTLGLEGDVYLTVPGESRGSGQVRVNIDRRQRIYNAISPEDELPSGTRIRVVKVNQDNTLTVSRA